MRRLSLPTVAILAALLAHAACGQSVSPQLVASAGDEPAFSTSALPAAPSFAAADPAPAYAHEHVNAPFSALGIEAKFGSTGLGFDLATPLIGFINLRGGATFFSYNPALSLDGISLAGSVQFQNAAISLDIFPLGSNFRFSPGLTVYNHTGLDASISVAGGKQFQLGDYDYISDPSNPIHGTADFTIGTKVAPRISFGYGNLVSKNGRWSFISETGIEFRATPTVRYSVLGNGCGAYNGVTYFGCGPVDPTSVIQEQTNFQNDLHWLRFYPIAYFGVGYKIGHTH